MQRAIWSPLRKLLAVFVLIGLGVGMSAAADEQTKRPISIIISPKMKSFTPGVQIVVEVAITNNTKDDLWFETCPLPYIIRVWEHGGRAFEIGRLDPNKEWSCYRTVKITIKPGETSTREVAINDSGPDLKPGVYDVEITWSFPVNVIRSQFGYDADILSVRSNKITISIAAK